MKKRRLRNRSQLKSPLVVGLTGPVASGKNETAKILAEYARVVDVDKIAHQLYQKGLSAHREILRMFGTDILGSRGRIDRKKLGAMVFASGQKRRRLNQLLHPKILSAVRRQVETAKGEKPIIINAALLIGIGLHMLCHRVWVVEAPVEKRLKRLRQRGFSIREARQRIKAQHPLGWYRKQADEIISNADRISDLRRCVRRRWIQLTREHHAVCL